MQEQKARADGLAEQLAQEAREKEELRGEKEELQAEIEQARSAAIMMMTR